MVDPKIKNSLKKIMTTKAQHTKGQEMVDARFLPRLKPDNIDTLRRILDLASNPRHGGCGIRLELIESTARAAIARATT
jgi:hypothetical protein